MSDSDNNNPEFNIDSFGEFKAQIESDIQEIATKDDKVVTSIRILPDNTKEWFNQATKLIDNFLMNYDSGKYFTIIKKIVQEEKESIEIDFNDLMNYDEDLATSLLTNPMQGIVFFEKALLDINDRNNFEYFNSKKYFGVKYSNYPLDDFISQVDVRKVNQLKVIRGFVSKTSDKKPYIYKFCLKCPDCGSKRYEDYDVDFCKNEKCDKKPVMRNIKSENLYTNCMFFRLQELSEDSKGKVPQSIECMAIGDTTEQIEAGQKIIVTGFIMLREVTRKLNKRTPYIVSVMVNNVKQFTSNDLNLISKIYLTDKDRQRFDDLSKNPNWMNVVIDSIAPLVYGMRDEKLGIFLSIVGGSKVIVNGEALRDRIHTLLCADPGKAKTRLLSFVKRIVLGSVLATGKGSSGGGLTAMTLKEADGTFSVVPGSLVLANRSVFMFDEADKVTEDVRSHLHESMENGTVTLNKGGHDVVLQALTTTIFACNPKFSSYQQDLSLAENINFPNSLISRFDMVFVIKDTTEYDKQITDHINYIYKYRSIPNSYALLSIEDLIKYIMYVKEKDLDPEIPDEVFDILQQDYFDLRSKNTNETIAVTTRQYEGRLRKVTAYARGSLSNIVTPDMARRIIELEKNQIRTIGTEPDGTINANFAEGKSRKSLGDLKFFLNVMADLEKEHDPNRIPLDKLKTTLEDKYEMTEKEVDKMIKKMKNDAVILENGEAYVRLSKYA